MNIRDIVHKIWVRWYDVGVCGNHNDFKTMLREQYSLELVETETLEFKYRIIDEEKFMLAVLKHL